MNENEATRIIQEARKLIDQQYETITNLRTEIKYLQEKIGWLEKQNWENITGGLL